MTAPSAREIAVAHARLKIEWAKVHIGGVKSLIEKIVGDNQNCVSIQRSYRPGQDLVSIGPRQHITPQLLLHVGDAVHNLNGVMDFLWSGLARDVDPQRASKITFPRAETLENLKGTLSSGLNAAIVGAFPEAENFVLKTVRPFKGPDDSLIWRLNKVDNISKHRLLIATTHVIKFEGELELVGGDGGRVVQTVGANLITQGSPMTIILTSPARAAKQPKATVAVVFDETDHFHRQSVLQTTGTLTAAVEEVIKAFQGTFVQPTSP